MVSSGDGENAGERSVSRSPAETISSSPVNAASGTRPRRLDVVTGQPDVGRSKGKRRLKPGSWPCVDCSKINSARRTECKACGMARGGAILTDDLLSGREGMPKRSDRDADRASPERGEKAAKSRRRLEERILSSRRGERGGGRRRSGGGYWTCKTCSTVNSEGRERCKTCSCPSPSNPAAAEGSEGYKQGSERRQSTRSGESSSREHRRLPHRKSSRRSIDVERKPLVDHDEDVGVSDGRRLDEKAGKAMPDQVEPSLDWPTRNSQANNEERSMLTSPAKDSEKRGSPSDKDVTSKAEPRRKSSKRGELDIDQDCSRRPAETRQRRRASIGNVEVGGGPVGRSDKARQQRRASIGSVPPSAKTNPANEVGGGPVGRSDEARQRRRASIGSVPLSGRRSTRNRGSTRNLGEEESFVGRSNKARKPRRAATSSVLGSSELMALSNTPVAKRLRAEVSPSAATYPEHLTTATLSVDDSPFSTDETPGIIPCKTSELMDLAEQLKASELLTNGSVDGNVKDVAEGTKKTKQINTNTDTAETSSPNSNIGLINEEESALHSFPCQDRRAKMKKSRKTSRSKRISMCALGISEQEELVLTPAFLEKDLVSIIRKHSCPLPMYCSLVIAAINIVAIILVMIFFQQPPRSISMDRPAWQLILSVGNQVLESYIEAFLFLVAVYLTVKKGSVLSVFFLRHVGFFQGLVGLTYVIADLSLFFKHGLGGSNGAEKLFRAALSISLAVSSGMAVILLQSRVCRSLQTHASSTTSGDLDEKLEKLYSNYKGLNIDERRVMREKLKQRYHRLMYFAVLGFQIVAIAVSLWSVISYVSIDLGSLDDFNLCTHATTQCVDMVIKTSGGERVNAAVKWKLQGGTLILSLINSMGKYGRSAFLLAIYSTASMFPHDADSVGIAALAATGQLVLSIGYLINITLLNSSEIEVKHLIWSAVITLFEAGFSALVIVSCFALTPVLRYQNEGDGQEHINNRALGCETLRSIAFSRRAPLSKKNEIWARSLYIATLIVFLLGSLQAILVLHRTALDYGDRFIAETVKSSMHIGLLYIFVNIFAVSKGRRYFHKARYVICTLSTGSIALAGWQIGHLLHPTRASTTMNSFVVTIIFIGMCANAFMVLSAIQLTSLQRIRHNSNMNSPLALADGNEAIDSNTRLLLAKIVEGDLRRRTRYIIYFHVVAVVLYSFSLSIFGGYGSVAPFATATEDHTLYEMIEASSTLTESYTRPDGLTRRYLSAINSRMGPFVFVPTVSRPGWEIFFHYGVTFGIFCIDGVRNQPRANFSLVTASTFAFHVFSLLLAFLIAASYSTISSAVSNEINEGVSSSNAAGVGIATNRDHQSSNVIPLLFLVVWFVALIPLAGSLHMLWKGRRRINNIIASENEAHVEDEYGKNTGQIFDQAKDEEDRLVRQKPSNVQDLDRQSKKSPHIDQKSGGSQGRTVESTELKSQKGKRQLSDKDRSSRRMKDFLDGQARGEGRRKSSKDRRRQSNRSLGRNNRRRSTSDGKNERRGSSKRRSRSSRTLRDKSSESSIEQGN